jgi:cupin 2 domain-containing protein
VNLFEQIPDKLGEELFTSLLNRDGVRIERIVSDGHASEEGFWYDQPEHEWILLVEGSARLVLEEGDGRLREVLLRSGDTLFLPARCRHRVEGTGADRKTIWLAIFWSPEEESGNE